MADYLTRENVLALVRSMGESEKMLASPGRYAHEDRWKAKRHEKPLHNCRVAYKRLLNGDDAREVLTWLVKVNNSNFARLAIAAINGEFETTLESLSKGRPTNGPLGAWVTVEGDLYYVSFGDELNLPHVARQANVDLPKGSDGIDTTGSQRIADVLPNPCTRIKAPARAH